MRFDEPRLSALKKCLDRLLTDAGLRSLLKDHSNLQDCDANQRLHDLREEGVALVGTCIQFTRWKAAESAVRRLLDDETTEEEFFLRRRPEIDVAILQKARSGNLGELPVAGGNQNDR